MTLHCASCTTTNEQLARLGNTQHIKIVPHSIQPQHQEQEVGTSLHYYVSASASDGELLSWPLVSPRAGRVSARPVSASLRECGPTGEAPPPAAKGGNAWVGAAAERGRAGERRHVSAHRALYCCSSCSVLEYASGNSIQSKIANGRKHNYITFSYVPLNRSSCSNCTYHNFRH